MLLFLLVSYLPFAASLCNSEPLIRGTLVVIRVRGRHSKRSPDKTSHIDRALSYTKVYPSSVGLTI